MGKWANFGLIIAAICTLDFYSEVLRFVDWGLFSHVSLYISSTNQIIFFPAWLIWLGIQLAEVPKFQQEDSAVPNDLQLDDEQAFAAIKSRLMPVCIKNH